MNRIIKSINSQIQPDKNITADLKAQIMNGRVPEIKKKTGFAVSIAAAAAAVIVGAAAINIANSKIDTSPGQDISTTETTSVTETSSIPETKEDRKIVFENRAEYNISSWSKIFSFDKLPDEDTMKSIAEENETITLNGVNYNIRKPIKIYSEKIAGVGDLLNVGTVNVNGKEYKVALTRMAGETEERCIFLNFGTNANYVYENPEKSNGISLANLSSEYFLYDNFEEIEILLNDSYVDLEALSSEEADAEAAMIDMLMPNVLDKLPKSEAEIMTRKSYKTTNVLNHLEVKRMYDYQPYITEAAADMPQESGFEICKDKKAIILINFGNKSKGYPVTLYENKETDQLLCVIKGKTKEYKIKMIRADCFAFELTDYFSNIAEPIGVENNTLYIDADEEKQKYEEVLTEITARTESDKYLIKDYSDLGDHPDNFRYGLQASGKVYYFGLYNISYKTKQPNIVIDRKGYRIPDKLADRLIKLAEDKLSQNADESSQDIVPSNAGVDTEEQTLNVDAN